MERSEAEVTNLSAQFQQLLDDKNVLAEQLQAEVEMTAEAETVSQTVIVLVGRGVGQGYIWREVTDMQSTQVQVEVMRVRYSASGY